MVVTGLHPGGKTRFVFCACITFHYSLHNSKVSDESMCLKLILLHGLGGSYIRPVAPSKTMKRILGKTISQGLVDTAARSTPIGSMGLIFAKPRWIPLILMGSM